jgi:tail assembly chaperone E/41/14-like protein
MTLLADTKEMTLRKPVEMGGVKLTKITLREPTALQLAQADSGANGVYNDIALIALSANIDPALAGQLAARDFMEAARWLGNFTRADPTSASGGSPTSQGSTAGDQGTPGV